MALPGDALAGPDCGIPQLDGVCKDKNKQTEEV
jgi:hypothetical protein